MTSDTVSAGGQRGRQARILAWAGAIALALSVPLVAMRFTREVNWGPLDFAVFGAMLAGAALAWKVAVGTSRSISYRLAAGIALAGGFFLTWANLAVGVIGDEDDPANLLFFGVLAVGVVGSVRARFRPASMARVLAAMAVLQAALAVYALAEDASVAAIVAAFAALWLVSAGLFRNAAREPAS